MKAQTVSMIFDREGEVGVRWVALLLLFARTLLQLLGDGCYLHALLKRVFNTEKLEVRLSKDDPFSK